MAQLLLRRVAGPFLELMGPIVATENSATLYVRADRCALQVTKSLAGSYIITGRLDYNEPMKELAIGDSVVDFTNLPRDHILHKHLEEMIYTYEWCP